MNILSSILAPESLAGIFVIKFGLFISLLILIPFMTIFIGSQLFALVHIAKSKLYGKSVYFEFSGYCSRLVTKNYWITLVFGIIPFIGVTFFYSQKMSQIGDILQLSFILFLIGISLSLIFSKNLENTLLNGDNSGRTYSIIGWLATPLLTFSSLILITIIQLSIIPGFSKIDSIFYVIFSIKNIIFFLLFLAMSFSLTSSVLLARMNRTKENYSYKLYGKEFAEKTGILFTFIQPLLYLLIIFSVDRSALSFSFFISSIFVLVLMLITTVQFYLNYKNSELRGTTIVFLSLLLIGFIVYSTQLRTETIEKKEAVKKGIVIEIFS